MKGFWMSGWQDGFQCWNLSDQAAVWGYTQKKNLDLKTFHSVTFFLCSMNVVRLLLLWLVTAMGSNWKRRKLQEQREAYQREETSVSWRHWWVRSSPPSIMHTFEKRRKRHILCTEEWPCARIYTPFLIHVLHTVCAAHRNASQPLKSTWNCIPWISSFRTLTYFWEKQDRPVCMCVCVTCDACWTSSTHRWTDVIWVVKGHLAMHLCFLIVSKESIL